MILDKIVATKRREVERAKRLVPWEELRDRVRQAPAVRDFHAALAVTNRVRVIAEVKKASPSAGVIRADFDPVAIAKAYQEGGAACISVLTDIEYFQGHLDYLRQVRAAVSIPVLRKDFIIDPYQLWEARAAGADAVLLIAECLTPHELYTLHQQTLNLGMHTLIELYDAENLPAVLATGGKLIGVNNRNLQTFQVDLQHSIRLGKSILQSALERLLISESGIKTVEDVQLLASAGVKGILVGESLMRRENLTAAVAELTGIQG
jgi:indole-3-glycerol phosphate synthase